MYCANCGAEISEDEAYCPYCGVMNPRAAEKEYMEKLEDIREDTENLGEASGRMTKVGIRHAGKHAFKVFAIVAVVVIGVAALGFYMDNMFMHSDSQSAREEAAFKEKYFSELDAIYEKGDDDATLDYMFEIGDEKGSFVMVMWKHYQYMMYYSDYCTVRSVPETDFNDDFWDLKYDMVLYDGLELIYQAEKSSRQKMSADEKEKVEGYRAEAERILAEYLNLTKSDLDEAYTYAADETGYMYTTKVREWAKKNRR